MTHVDGKNNILKIPDVGLGDRLHQEVENRRSNLLFSTIHFNSRGTITFLKKEGRKNDGKSN
jgi:hypothetical protein